MANAFEAGARKAVPAVLVYAFCGESVLMIHRDNGQGARGAAVDYHHGKWNGLGGKLEPDESFSQAARRELREESELDLADGRLRPLGFLQFPNFKAHKSEDWLVQVFVAEVSETEAARVPLATEEGSLHWIPASDVPMLNLWPGDRHFIPLVVAKKPFFGTFWYRSNDLQQYELRELT